MLSPSTLETHLVRVAVADADTGQHSKVSLSSARSPSTLQTGLVHAAVVDGDAGARLLVLGLCLDDHLDQFK